MHFPIKARFETGQEFFKFSFGREVFFRRGVTTAFFRLLGILPSVMNLLMIFVIDGNRAGSSCLTRSVGIGSILHDFEFPPNINFETSESQILTNDSR